VRYQVLGEKWEKTLEKAGIQILNKRLSSTEQLATSLQIFIEAAEQGEWDRIADFSGQLLLELELAAKPESLSGTPSVDRKDIENTLFLLKSAIEKCNTRKSEIAPLINAFARPHNTPEAP
jgi:hypothetical protein